MPPQPKSPAFQPCPWNVQDWSGTEDSSDTCPDATASSAQEPFAHSFALAQVRLPHQVRQPTTAPTMPQPINSPNPPADPNTPIPWPKPKPPPPQRLLSNAGSILPPLPAGPRLAQHQFFAFPIQTSAPAIKTAHAADSVPYTCRHCNAPMPTCSPYMVYPHRRSCPRLHGPDIFSASATYWPASGLTLAHKIAAHFTSLTGGLPPMPAGTWQACQCLTQMTTPTRGRHRALAPLPQWVPSLCRCCA